MARIIVVDDEKEIADLVSLFLRKDGYEVETFYDPLEALVSIEVNPPDGLILDVMMPKLDGIDLLTRIRENHDFPIILLTAKTHQDDVLEGLYAGADDYIKKPFDVLEVRARLKIHLKRNGKEGEVGLRFRHLTLNEDTHQCTLNGEVVPLTPIEFQIMLLLLKNKGNVLPSEEIFREVWQEKYFEMNANTVSVHIRRIREKFGKVSKEESIITTVWGVGYRIG